MVRTSKSQRMATDTGIPHTQRKKDRETEREMRPNTRLNGRERKETKKRRQTNHKTEREKKRKDDDSRHRRTRHQPDNLS